VNLQGLKVKICDFQNLSALTKTTEQKHRNSYRIFVWQLWLAVVQPGFQVDGKMNMQWLFSR